MFIGRNARTNPYSRKRNVRKVCVSFPIIPRQLLGFQNPNNKTYVLLLVCPFYSKTMVRQHCWARAARGSYAMRSNLSLPSVTSIELQSKKISAEALTKTRSNACRDAVPALRSSTRVSVPSANRYLRGPCWHSRSSNISSWTSARFRVPKAAQNTAAIYFHVRRIANKTRVQSPFSNDDSCVDFVAIDFVSVDEGG